METLKFDLTKKSGKFKILNATNGGPWHKRHANDQARSNLEDYKAARIPYSRNHDSALFQEYGGPYSHDISCIFPNFDADVDDPKSYDFECTDESILCCLDAGTETFFRLGQTIEHQIKKHAIFPPKDFKKWAKVCEHIIRHYNEGWANGYKLNIQYWEIWNEPDLDREDNPYKRTWTGTKMQFFDFYEVCAKYLKECFPNLKIGGPASCGRVEWCEEFIEEMSKRNVPIDFFSWHVYCNEPEQMIYRAGKIKECLVRCGYENTESNCNEWNYIRNWQENFVYSIKSIIGIKGAAFTMACISESQRVDTIDMLMYYDTRPSVFCGVFDYYTYEPLKGYYPLYWYGMFYDMDAYVKSETNIENIYSLCGVDKDGKSLSVITYYSENDDAPDKEVKVDFGKEGKYEIYLLDKDHNGEYIKTTGDLTFNLKVHSCVLIKEI
ncbi:MAG: hypothetical protein E7391_06795 [Ruminococcaceae bacterium]|nr:hypothetical protein [Oscillospiraceae bacterium]